MFASVRAGHGCRNCAYKEIVGKNKKGGAKPIKHEIAEAIMVKAGLQPLETYVRNSHKWKCKCLKCGAIVHPRYQDIRRGGGGCRPCGNAKMAKSLTLSSDKAVRLMLGANLKPLEEYKGATKRWKSKCLICNKIVYPSYSNVSRGSNGCVYCSKQEVDPEDVVKRMIKSKLIEAPTPIKNKPNKRPLKGAISPSNSCLNSEFANTTPAIKAPKAGLNPTNCIR
jgi:hypothetical protein